MSLILALMEGGRGGVALMLGNRDAPTCNTIERVQQRVGRFSQLKILGFYGLLSLGPLCSIGNTQH